MPKTQSLTKVISAVTARTQLGQVLRRVNQKNERFLIDRRGEPQAVIMGIKEYIDRFAPAPEELRAMQATARRTGRSKLTMREIRAIVEKARKQGRSLR